MLEKIRTAVSNFIMPSGNKSQGSMDLIKQMSDIGFTFSGSDLSTLSGQVRIDLGTMYRIGKSNKMAGAYIEKIANMVGRYGFELYDEDDNLIDLGKDKVAKEAIKRITKIFKTGYGDNKSFDLLCILYFTHVFSSGEVSIVPNKMNGLNKMPDDGYMKILDTRAIKKKLNDYGEIASYEYKAGKTTEKFTDDEIVNYVAYPDVDNPTKGLSKFNRIYMEALSNFEASSRQMYFFKNNAMPNVMVMLDPEKMIGPDGTVTQNVNDFKSSWDKKYKGNQNQGEPLVTTVVKDIKVLDTSNVDMDLITMRKENDKDFAVIFLMDTRLIGINKENGSYGEVESTTIRQGNDQIDAYGEMLSDTINIMYRKFVDPEFAYTIKTKNSYFTNDKEERTLGMKEVELGLRTPNKYVKDFQTGSPGPEIMDQYREPKTRQPETQQPAQSN